MMQTTTPGQPHESLAQMLNQPTPQQRLSALGDWCRRTDPSDQAGGGGGRDVNNHIHTIYSFSPYSPSAAAWQARQAGLATAGLMDHDSIAGALEFIEAGRLLHLPVTIGLECRVSLQGLPFSGRHINNPDQRGVAYIALHGVPHHQIPAVQAWLEPIRQARFQRSLAMTGRLNHLMKPYGLSLDFEQDIIPLSCWEEGGEITERHILFALAGQLLDQSPDGKQLVERLEHDLRLPLTEKQRGHLQSPQPYRRYDLLGLLKGHLVERFYLDAGSDECPPAEHVTAWASEHGLIPAYAYLGDVTDSVTGDKKSQAFEDEFLDDLFKRLPQLGFQAVTYMPSRNQRAQLERVQRLCREYGLFQISGEDINQPRQAFVCQAMRDPMFSHLYDAAWALIAHERAGDDAGLFSETARKRWPALEQRVRHYAGKARHDMIH